MKPFSLKKLLLIFSSVASIGSAIAFACADGWFYYDYDSNFTPEVFVDKSYTPLFFAPGETFYGNSFDTNYNGRFNDQTLEDWSAFLGTLVPQKQLSFLLLNDSATHIIQALYAASKKMSKPIAPFDKLPLSNPKVRALVEFLYYAKAIETSSVTKADPWDYEDEKRSSVPIDIRTSVERVFNETKDPFLKNRYWFQTMKAYFYGSENKDLILFFNKTKAQQPKNSLYYRGLSYVAGVHYRAKNFATANYLYSQVFSEFPPLRQVAAYNFHPQEDSDFSASLTLATNHKDKAALWALIGYYDDEFTAIREINNIDPSSEHLSYLLTRLINKLESEVNNMTFESAAAYKSAMQGAVKKEVLAQVESMAVAGKTAQPELWLIAAGYLNTFAGNFVRAENYLTKAAELKRNDAEIDRQVRLLKIINTLCSVTKIDETTEKRLLPEIQWLYQRCGSAGEEFRCSHVINWSGQYISSLYDAGNNPLMSELFHRKNTFYRSQLNIDAMKSFLQGTAKSDWQRQALKRYSISLSDILEYEAIMFAYAGDLDSAIRYLESSKRDNDLLGNPFNGKIKDCHDCDHAAPQKVTYTKLSMLKKMKEMQANIDNGVDVYNNSLLVANAYYNITYHGNARVFYSNEIINQDGNYIDVYYHPQLLGCARAKLYYQKAFDAASNQEQKAKCVYMMAKCERNEYYSATAYLDESKFDPDFISWQSFQTLKADYANTRYYQEVIKECGYFKTYVNR